jgi:hypothetical protein
MSDEDELAKRRSLTLDALAGRPWVIFERRMHPPVYDAVMRLAAERNVVASKYTSLRVIGIAGEETLHELSGNSDEFK